MRTTLDRGRTKQCAIFVMDVEKGTLIECPHCGQHQVAPDWDTRGPPKYLCDNTTCRKEIFYPEWAEW